MKAFLSPAAVFILACLPCGFADRLRFSEPNHHVLRGNNRKAQVTPGNVTCLPESNAIDDSSYTGCTVVENFESGSGGWSFDQSSSTCASGEFVVGTPSFMTSSNIVTQVCGDHTTGTGSAFYSADNLSPGFNDVDDGECIGTSPVYSVTQESSVSIWYFHGQRDGGDDSGDFFALEMSLDGGNNWGSTLASHGDETVNAAWTEATAIVPADSDVMFRIRASDGNARGDLIEAGVDDLVICPIGPKCTSQADCDDGVFCNGEESCVDGACIAGSAPCPVKFCLEGIDRCVECLDSTDCDNGAFCDGAETCLIGVCLPGSDPCPGRICNESTDTCVDCLVDGDCDNGSFCDGAESCVNGLCQSGSTPCTARQVCDESSDICVTTMASMEAISITEVGQKWTNVPLHHGFVHPVPVCTIHYKGTGFSPPAVVRMKNAVSTSFQIMLQNPSGAPLVAQDVNCLVVENGAWLMPNGNRIEAWTYKSTVTDRKGSWIGEPQPSLSSFMQPVVIGQILSFNDSDWSVFWSRGSIASDPPSSTTFFAGKHVGEDNRTNRNDETVGYIVIESSHDVVGNIEYEAGTSADAVRGYLSFSHEYEEAFPSTPDVAVATQVAMDGGDGSWTVLSGTQSSTAISLAVSEDQIADAERLHVTEQVAYVAFGSQGSLPLTAA